MTSSDSGVPIASKTARADAASERLPDGHVEAADVRRPLILAVPFYKAEHLVAPLVRSIELCGEELRRLDAEVLLLNDSPDHSGLAHALDGVSTLVKGVNDLITIETNPKNLGFVGTMNKAFDRAREAQKDIVILNSDTVLFPGALEEMVAVSRSDHMIGFVCPRSNNATICSLPRQEARWNSVPAEAYTNHARIAKHLPRKTYVPTAVGFCMLIKYEVLAEFGGFDTIYGAGYNEENDLVCRAGVVGYRAVLANRAFVWHEGEQSFSQSDTPKSRREEVNRKILVERYPHYLPLIHAYDNSSYQQAEYLMGGLLPDATGRLRVAFDFSHFGLHHNGTYEAAKALLAEACKAWRDDYQLYVLVSEAAWKFHGLDRYPNLERSGVDSSDCFAAIIRIGQPFEWDAVQRLAYKSPVVAISMLDTIALDCGPLYDQEVYRIWQFVCEHTDAFLTISQYTMDQFESRFEIAPGTVKKASLLSVDVGDYAKSLSGKVDRDIEGAIFIVGNHFPHKHVTATLDALLEAMPEARFIVLGVPSEDGRVTSYKAGELTDEEIASIYRSCSAVVFPSHYEGFGLPILHALGSQKPLFLRRMPVYDEILGAMGGSKNAYFFSTTAELAKMLTAGVPDWIPEAVSSGNGWVRATADLREAVEDAIEQLSFERVVSRLRGLEVRRLAHLPAAPVPAPAEPEATGEQADIKVAAAKRMGRIAQSLSLRAFRIPGVLASIRLVNRVIKPLRRLVGR